MGQDLIGLKPTNEKGKCFSINWTGWHPLWNYVFEVANGVLTEEQKRFGECNEGHEIGADDCKKIAPLLSRKIESGDTKMYESSYKEYVKSTAVPCEVCKGTGIKENEVTAEGQEELCESCRGAGSKEDEFTVSIPYFSDGERVLRLDRQCPFSEESVKEFLEFLQNCGGFQLW